MNNRVSNLIAWMGLALAPGLVWADGFTVGQLLVSNNQPSGGVNRVYEVDPANGATTILWTTASGSQTLGDLVYNRGTGSAFVLVNPGTSSSSIVQVAWSSSAGYTATTFLAGLNNVHALAADGAGNIYFDRNMDPFNRQIWKADPSGQLTAVSPLPAPQYFFSAVHMALSPDESVLYITASPQNRVDVLRLSDGGLSFLGASDVGFPSGIDSDSNGALYVTRHFTGANSANNDIATVSPQSGAVSTYLHEDWMAFLQTGYWGDLEYDRRNGTIYVEKKNILYAIDASLQSRQVKAFGFADGLPGLDMIEIPEPSTLVLLGACAIGLLAWAGCFPLCVVCRVLRCAQLMECGD